MNSPPLRNSQGPHLDGGFNRRFMPLVLIAAAAFPSARPKAFVYTCNAGAIPAEHWIQDPAVGGGRLLGEACHFVDLLRFLAASPIEELQLLAASGCNPCPDTFTLQLRFANGSIGTVHYFANGSKAFPKERLEVFAGGKVMQLDNYRKLKAWGIPGFRTRRLLSQDKGQEACWRFPRSDRIRRLPPILTAEIFEVQRWLLEAVNHEHLLRSWSWIYRLATAALLARSGHRDRCRCQCPGSHRESGSILIVEPDLDGAVADAVASGALSAQLTPAPADVFDRCSYTVP